MRTKLTILLLILSGSSVAAPFICTYDRDYDGSIQQSEMETCSLNSEGDYLCPMERNDPVEMRTACAVNTDTEELFCPGREEEGSGACEAVSGASYCKEEPIPCYDKESVPSTVTDTDQDWPSDSGPRDENGYCLGQIRIFGGRGMRCREPGNQTVWQDCCKNKRGEMFDTTGKSGQPNQQDYKEEATSVEFWDNQCDIQDQQTAQLADSEYCLYLGDYCAERWALIGCVQENRSYCCFSSKLAKIIQEQGKAQLGLGFGSKKNPDCRGFTPEQFQALDFSKMDMSGYAKHIQTKAQNKILGEGQDAIIKKWKAN